MRTIQIFLVLLIFGFLPGYSQIESPGLPWSIRYRLKTAPPVLELPRLSKTKIEKFSSGFQERQKPFLFAYPFDTLISIDKDGSWFIAPDGSRIWRMTVRSRDAFSLNLIFSKFRLPKGAELYLYTTDQTTIRGAFTSANHTKSGQLPTVPLPGESITVELDLPAFVEFAVELEISRISHDFTGIFQSGKDMEKSGSCNVDINCPAGSAWQIEKKAVVKFIRGGTWLCSGSLINNTANDGRALFYTANHCIGLQSHAEQSVFFFLFERSGCGSGTASTSKSLTGSNLLATYNKLDFSLVEFATPPPQNYEPYYAGWDRRVVTYHDTVVAIHHPNGDAKKISKSYHRVVTGDFGGGFDANTHWRISQWDLGTTEPGSSGCPLFNTDHKIIGDLTGGDASCEYNFNDYFQKFMVCWDRYPDSSNQLKHWLDPLDNGSMVINGYDPFQGGKPLANFEIRPDPAEVGKKIFFTDRTTGLPTNWDWLFDSGIPGLSNDKNPSGIVFGQSGIYQVSLKAANQQGSDSIRQTIRVMDHGGYTASETRIVTGRVVTLTDRSTGSPLSVTWEVPGAFPPVWSTGGEYKLTFANEGDYSVKQIVEYPDFTKTFIHYNQIRVLPESLTLAARQISNVGGDEHTNYRPFGSQGYFPGSNSLGIKTFAESFRNTGDSTTMITGMSVPVEVLSGWSDNYYLTCYIWNARWEPMTRDSVNISDMEPGSRFTIRFPAPVNFDTLVYAGYELKPWDRGTFVSKTAVDRGEKGANTAFVKNSGSWVSVPDILGLNTSLDISLEFAVISNSFKEQVTIYPAPNQGQFTVNMGNLVFQKVDLTVFDINGRQVSSTVTRFDNVISFGIDKASAGIYLIRMRIDFYEIVTKVLVIN